MTSHRQKYPVARAALFVIFLTIAPAIVRADVPVDLTRIGNPIWSPTDFHLFTAPADSDETFFAIADMIIGSPDGPPRDPPYDNIISENLAAAGFQDATVFASSDIDGAPLGVYFGYTLLPDPGETGSSHDFASGPIIPNRVFPLTTDVDLYRDGVFVISVFDSVFPPTPSFGGQSNITTLVETDAAFFPPGLLLPGNYEYRSVERDALGNGWDIVAPFQVVPEPSSLTLCFVLVLATLVTPFRCGRTRQLLEPKAGKKKTKKVSGTFFVQ